jgi:phospholipase A1/A2
MMKFTPRLLALLLATTAGSATAQTIFLAATDKPAEVDIVLLNETAAPVVYDTPRFYPVQVRIEGVAALGSLNRDASVAEKITLEPGAFKRVRYLLTDASKFTGPATIQLTDHPTALTRVVLGEIQAPATPATNAASAESTQRTGKLNLFRDPNYVSEAGLVEYLAYRFKPYEPIYFLAGDVDPIAKFQVSLKYQVFDPKGPVAQAVPPMGNLYIAYSQTSFWDLRGTSKPFFDNSYRPEVFFLWTDIDKQWKDSTGQRGMPDWMKLDVQLGLGHESNGRDGPDSRSMNRVFLRPTLTLGNREEWFVSVGPRFFQYVGDLSDNPDISEYFGDWVDLKVVAGQGGGLQLAAIGRMGNDWDRGSIQLDLSFPVRQLSSNSLDVFFHAQYFNGYGESLRTHRENDSSLRLGFSLVR